MITRTLLYKLFHQALREIQKEGEKGDDKFIFELAKWLERIPLQLEEVAQRKLTNSEVFLMLINKPIDDHVKRWLEYSLKDIKRWQLPEPKIYRLLNLAMIDIRDDAYSSGNMKLFCLADMFHNFSLKMYSATSGELAYDDVMKFIRSRAIGTECESWLAQTLRSEE